jgi:UDP-glucose-4-epimerase GalE
MGARVLVVGGAGYIGSVCARHLARRGDTVETLDDLSTGHAAAATGPLHRVDLRDRAEVNAVLARGFDAVLHFAARSLVGESVQAPLPYFDVNIGGTLVLLDAMARHGVSHLVFSSTCAVYGDPIFLPLTEAHPFAPVSPYGLSKRVVEDLLAALRARGALRVTTLRYFNAAGATADGALGEAHRPETHLIPLAIAAARGERPPLSLFGEDYPTPDGTCIRDYVHVEDLAAAHAAALDRLLAGDAGGAYNLGTGRGHSVREVLDAVASVVGQAVPVVRGPRRAGDPAALFADPSAAAAALGWRAERTSLRATVASAAEWAARPRF